MSVREGRRTTIQMQKDQTSSNNSFGDFLANNGLYDAIEIKKTNINELMALVEGHVKIDCFCPKCREKRVFLCRPIPYYWTDDDKKYNKGLLGDYIGIFQRNREMKRVAFAGAPEEPWAWTNGSFEDTRIMVFNYYCAMDNTHKLDYVVLTNDNKMIKIGQYPSVADLSFPELKEFNNVMSKDDETELKRAIGLFAHGIGVGSFVYLRRIIERMIENAGRKAINENDINETDFKNAGIDRKIKMLSDYLPEMLATNTMLYRVISKGIHELSEDECLEYFPVMQSIIMMILRQWENKRKDEEEKKDITAALGKINSKING